MGLANLLDPRFDGVLPERGGTTILGGGSFLRDKSRRDGGGLEKRGVRFTATLSLGLMARPRATGYMVVMGRTIGTFKI